MQPLGVRKTLGLSIPLGRTVQRFGRPPLGQFSARQSLQRQPSPTLGQKLQAQFEQNNQSGSSESKAPNFSAQFIETSFVESSTEPVDRQSLLGQHRPESPTAPSTLDTLAPLGRRQPLAVRSPLTQSENFLSLKAAPENSVGTSSAVNLSQLKDKGATATPDRLKQQVQTQIQAQLEQRSPASTSIQPIQPHIESLSGERETVSATPSSTEHQPLATSVTETQSAPESLQRSPHPQPIPGQLAAPTANQTDVHSPAKSIDRQSEAIEADPQANSTQFLQQQAEPQQSTVEQAQSSQAEPISDSVVGPVSPSQVESTAHSASTNGEEQTSLAESIAPAPQAPAVTSEAQPSTSTLQLKSDSISPALKPPEATASPSSSSESIAKSEIGQQTEADADQLVQLSSDLSIAEQSIDPSTDLSTSKPAPNQPTVSQPSLQQRSIESTFSPNAPQRRSEAQVETVEQRAPAVYQEQPLDFATPEPTDQVPAEAGQPTTANLVQRSPSPVEVDQPSPVETNQAIAPKTEIDPQPQSASIEDEQSQSSLQSSSAQIQRQSEPLNLTMSDSTANVLQDTAQPTEQKQLRHFLDKSAPSSSTQAKHQSTIQPKNAAETATVTPLSPVLSTELKTPVEPAIQQKPLSKNQLAAPTVSQVESIAPLTASPQIEPEPTAEQTSMTQQENLPVFERAPEPLTPLSDNSPATIQRQVERSPDVTETEMIEATADLREAIAPSPLEQQSNPKIALDADPSIVRMKHSDDKSPQETQVPSQILRPSSDQQADQPATNQLVSPDSSTIGAKQSDNKSLQETQIPSQMLRPNGDQQADQPSAINQPISPDSTPIRAKHSDDKSLQETQIPSRMARPNSNRIIDQQQPYPLAQSDPSTLKPVEQSGSDPTAPNRATPALPALDSIPIQRKSDPTAPDRAIPALPQHQPLGLAKPLAAPPNLLTRKYDPQADRTEQQADFTAIESTSPATASPTAWSSLDDLLDQSSAATVDPWQRQFNLQSPVEKLTSPIAESSTETATVDSQVAQSHSGPQYTLTSPPKGDEATTTLTPSNQQNRAIDEQKLELLAQLIYGLIRDRLVIEKERYFHISTHHPPWADIISPEFFKSITLTDEPNSPNVQQQPAAIIYPPPRRLEELTQVVYQLIQQKLIQDRERSR